jgi:hypothetical protein
MNAGTSASSGDLLIPVSGLVGASTHRRVTRDLCVVMRGARNAAPSA